MNDKDIAALADRIAEARRSRKVIDFLAADAAVLSEADAYKVQFAVHDRLTAGGNDRMAGWKVALTLPSQYEPLKLSGPVFAGIYGSGVRPTGTVFEKGWPLKAGIECEKADLFDRTMRAEWDAAGQPMINDVAQKRAQDIINDYQPKPLDKDVQDELNAIVAEGAK